MSYCWETYVRHWFREGHDVGHQRICVPTDPSLVHEERAAGKSHRNDAQPEQSVPKAPVSRVVNVSPTVQTRVFAKRPKSLHF